LIIEVDGPHHFLGNTYMQRPNDILKDRLLEKLGWHVERIPYFVWKQESDKKAYLHRTLKPYGVTGTY